MTFSDITRPTRIAVVVAVLGFFVSVTTLSTSTMGGVYSCSFTDFGALLFGALSIAFGGFAALRATGGPANARAVNMALSVGALAVGGLHVLRGFGTVGGPC